MWAVGAGLGDAFFTNAHVMNQAGPIVVLGWWCLRHRCLWLHRAGISSDKAAYRRSVGACVVGFAPHGFRRVVLGDVYGSQATRARKYSLLPARAFTYAAVMREARVFLRV